MRIENGGQRAPGNELAPPAMFSMRIFRAPKYMHCIVNRYSGDCSRSFIYLCSKYKITVRNYLAISAIFHACSANMISYQSLGDRNPAESHLPLLTSHVEVSLRSLKFNGSLLRYQL